MPATASARTASRCVNDPIDNAVAVGPSSSQEAVRFVVEHAGQGDGREGGRLLGPRQRTDALAPDPPRRAAHASRLRRTVGAHRQVRGGDQEGRPDGEGGGLLQLGLDRSSSTPALDQGKDNYRDSSPDWQHGKVPLCEWFIKKCGEYKKEHGKPLVDVFDTHWYPQGNAQGPGRLHGEGTESTSCAVSRMRSTRPVDPKYSRNRDQEPRRPADGRWCRGFGAGSRSTIPGWRPAVGEYNFGGSDNVSGGLAQAETFGILAREKVDLAFIWYAPEGTQEARDGSCSAADRRQAEPVRRTSSPAVQQNRRRRRCRCSRRVAADGATRVAIAW